MTDSVLPEMFTTRSNKVRLTMRAYSLHVINIIMTLDANELYQLLLFIKQRDSDRPHDKRPRVNTAIIIIVFLVYSHLYDSLYIIIIVITGVMCFYSANIC